MRKFLTLFAVIIALCIGGVAQKRTAFDPCKSKDPKVRATAKKPCPSAPATKKINPPPPDETGDKTTDKDDSPKKGKQPKKPEEDGSMFSITIESGGRKIDIDNSQFETRGGQAMMENEQSAHMTLFYGASNHTNNDDNFSFQGRIPAAATGNYSQGEDGFNLSFETTAFPRYQILLCDSASYQITSMPTPEGVVAKHTKFVEGTFSCTGEALDDSGLNKIQYTMTGKFKLPRFS